MSNSLQIIGEIMNLIINESYFIELNWSDNDKLC